MCHDFCVMKSDLKRKWNRITRALRLLGMLLDKSPTVQTRRKSDVFVFSCDLLLHRGLWYLTMSKFLLEMSWCITQNRPGLTQGNTGRLMLTTVQSLHHIRLLDCHIWRYCYCIAIYNGGCLQLYYLLSSSSSPLPNK